MGFINTIEAQARSIEPLKRHFSPGDKASNARSDTLDVLNYTVHLDMTDVANKRIAGNCEVTMVAKQSGISTVYLDLLRLTVDSVISNGNPLVFSHNDTLLRLTLPAPLNSGDTLVLDVYYQGKPVRDGAWGGFYFQGNYAYNLGVGFEANPHNYGRVWFPCFDNFVERSTFDFYVKTADGRKSHCNGELMSEVSLGGDTIERHWQMNEPIPSYLACVAVGNYETVHMNHSGMLKTIPIELAAEAVDTTNVKASFIHLNDAIDAYETAYGPYLFNKVGYSIVPFNAGAMEHATNIAYPRYAVNGSLTYETLMAHELAHHWWGDLVTCETAEDMWLNEGMASYSEHLFLESLYGKADYLEAVQANHMSVLQYAHVREKAYRAVSGVPHEYTYGMHVYDKGAAMAHNLRGYLGDSLFFNGLQVYLSDNAFDDVNSIHLRDELSSITGIDLTPFFSDWIFNPGFSHFSIDSVKVTGQSAPYSVEVFVRQKLRGAQAFHKNVPIVVSCWGDQFQLESQRALLSGEFTTVQLSLPFVPEFTALNVGMEINQAITADQFTIDAAGMQQFQFGKMNVDVRAVVDSVLLRVEHHWATPDKTGIDAAKTILSDYRYWSVDGLHLDKLDASAELYFDGRNFSSGGEGQLDVDLLKTGEDSLLLLYQSAPGEDWVEFRSYTVDPLGNMNDRYGKINIDTLRKGAYVLAKGHSVLGKSKGTKAVENLFSVYPNPANSELTVEVDPLYHKRSLTLTLFDSNGKRLAVHQFTNRIDLDLELFAAGQYVVVLEEGKRRLGSQSVIVYH
jgi:aminopeptidase N